MDIPRNRDITYFAKTLYRDTEQKFGIKRRDRRQHMYVLGKSGTGKSAMLKNMVIQNIANGEGVAVVDPHGELVEEILEMIPPERKNDVVYFNPADTDYYVGFNVLEVPDPKYKHLIASGLMGIFTKIWANVWSSRMEYILNNCILALLDTPGSTMLGIPRLLVDQDYRQSVLANVTDPVVRSFWITEYEAWQERFRNEAIAPIQNKVGQFLSSTVTRNIVGQSKSTINIFDIMNNKKILLVNVSKGRVGEDNSALLGAMLITKIQLAAMERVRIPEEERKDFYLYVDEFQNFVTDSFASILSEARKYRLNLVLAHQYINQLIAQDSTAVRDAVFGNVGTMTVFRVGASDAEFIEKEFEPEFTPQDFVNLPNYHIYTKLMIDGITSRPFSAKTLPPFKVDTSHAIAREIIEHSRALYARPREDVEAEINNWTRSNPGAEDAPDATEDLSSIKPSSDGRYRVKCSLFDECGNVAEVPFKPEKGKPIYCRDHIQKIKSGEIKPVRTQKPKPNPKIQESRDVLADIGIAFAPEAGGKRGDRKIQPKPKKEPKIRRVRIADRDEKESVPDDGTSLKDILQEALGKETKTGEVERPEPKEEKKEEPKKEQATISLSDLAPKKDISQDTGERKEKRETTTTFTPNFSRVASSDSMDTLKETLEHATKEQEKELEEQKKILQQVQAEAEKKAKEAHEKLEQERKQREEAEQEKESLAGKLLEEEKKRKQVEEEKEEHKKKASELEESAKKRAEELLKKDEEAIQTPTPPPIPETPKEQGKKEVPEDILKRVLE